MSRGLVSRDVSCLGFLCGPARALNAVGLRTWAFETHQAPQIQVGKQASYVTGLGECALQEAEAGRGGERELRCDGSTPVPRAGGERRTPPRAGFTSPSLGLKDRRNRV